MMNTKDHLDLTREEALEMLEQYGTPEHVKGHCKAVARVSLILGEALNQRGFSLDLRLIEVAGLLHDMARTSKDHELVASNYLLDLGYKGESDIIKVHMHYSEFNPLPNINETDVVCLGDRLCKEDKYVGVEERMNYVIEKAMGHPEIVAIIERKKQELIVYLNEIEDFLGITMDELMKVKND